MHADANSHSVLTFHPIAAEAKKKARADAADAKRKAKADVAAAKGEIGCK
jgi:hypothetical protein